jgi:hypothetical protein
MMTMTVTMMRPMAMTVIGPMAHSILPMPMTAVMAAMAGPILPMPMPTVMADLARRRRAGVGLHGGETDQGAKRQKGAQNKRFHKLLLKEPVLQTPADSCSSLIQILRRVLWPFPLNLAR